METGEGKDGDWRREGCRLEKGRMEMEKGRMEMEKGRMETEEGKDGYWKGKGWERKD